MIYQFIQLSLIYVHVSTPDLGVICRLGHYCSCLSFIPVLAESPVIFLGVTFPPSATWGDIHCDQMWHLLLTSIPGVTNNNSYFRAGDPLTEEAISQGFNSLSFKLSGWKTYLLFRRIKIFIKKLSTKVKCFYSLFSKSLFFLHNTWTITRRFSYVVKYLVQNLPILCSKMLGTKSSNFM